MYSKYIDTIIPFLPIIGATVVEPDEARNIDQA